MCSPSEIVKWITSISLESGFEVEVSTADASINLYNKLVISLKKRTLNDTLFFKKFFWPLILQITHFQCYLDRFVSPLLLQQGYFCFIQ